MRCVSSTRRSGGWKFNRPDPLLSLGGGFGFLLIWMSRISAWSTWYAPELLWIFCLWLCGVLEFNREGEEGQHRTVAITPDMSRLELGALSKVDGELPGYCGCMLTFLYALLR